MVTALFVLFFMSRINWWNLAILLITSGVFLVFIFNFDNLRKLLLQQGKGTVFLEMKDVLPEYNKRKKDGAQDNLKIEKKPKIVHEEIISINILDRKYLIRAKGEEDKEYVYALAAFLNSKMMEISEKAKTQDFGKIAVLAALNIADDYFVQQKIKEQKEEQK